MSSLTGVECQRDFEGSHWLSSMGVGDVGSWAGRQVDKVSNPLEVFHRTWLAQRRQVGNTGE